jgi:hypothetical protein
MICLLKYSLAAIILQRSGDVAVLLNPVRINAGNLSPSLPPPTHCHHPNLLNLLNPTCHSCQAVILWEVDPIFCSYCDSYYHTLYVSWSSNQWRVPRLDLWWVFFIIWLQFQLFNRQHNLRIWFDIQNYIWRSWRNQQDSNNVSYLKLHLPDKGLRFG